MFWLQIFIYQIVLLMPCYASHAQSPPACTRAGAEYRCVAASGAYSVRATRDRGAEITCHNGTLSTNLPPLSLSPPRLQSLVVQSCALIGSLRGVLGAIGARAARRVEVRDAPTAVSGGQLEGIDVEALVLENIETQTSLPFEAFSRMAHLSSVEAYSCPIQLSPMPPNDHLRELVLVDSAVDKLPPGALGGLSGLTWLTLAGSGLEELVPGSFRGLTHLETLQLTRQPLRSLPSLVLSDAVRLRHLRVRAAPLCALATNALSGLHDLETIEIDICSSTLTLEPHSLSNLTSLLEVNITATPLAPLPGELLRGSRALRKLKLVKCGLEVLPIDLFEDQSALVDLNLSSNRLLMLHEEQFAALASLRHLDLSYNQLQALPESIFSGLSELVTLRLDHNHLASIPLRTFHGTNSLQFLSLSRNNLTLLEGRTPQPVLASPFEYLKELRHLNLSHNEIGVVFDDWKVSVVRLKVLDLSYNKIKYLRANDTQFLSPVTLNLTHNEISSIEVKSDLVNRPETAIKLGNNPIRCDCRLHPFLNYTTHHRHNFQIDEAYCASPQELSNITLSTVPLETLTCDIEECPNNCTCLIRPEKSDFELDCKQQPKLTDYSERYNAIRSKLKLQTLVTPIVIPANVYSLNLSNLNLVDVPLIPNTVKELDLRDNPIETIPARLPDVFLYLPNNTLKCDCSTQDELKGLNGFKIHNFADVVCKDGRYLAKIDVEGICDVFYASTIGGVLGTVGILSIIVAILVYRNVRTIKHLIYDMGWGIFITEEEIDGKQFDVLISYTDEYEKFVVEKLVPILEEEGYTVCVRYRDWDIGDWIPGKTAQLVEQSRRTLVLLSNGYLESLPCLEMQAALINERRGKWKRVVPVVTKDYDPDPKLENFLAAKKSLKLEEESFWPLLRSRLPKKRVKRQISSRLKQSTLNVLMTAEGNIVYSSKKSLER